MHNLVRIFQYIKVQGLLGIILCLAMLSAGGLTGCADLKPWVKPYERDKLADPIMNASRHGYASAYMDHVYQARESSRGGEGGKGGGCGCN